MRFVDLLGVHVEATSGMPVVILREHDAPHRVLPIFIGGLEATAIALKLSGQEPPRPQTYDLMAALVHVLGGHVEAVEVTEVRDGAFVANLALTGPGGEHRLDCRPSDAIALAVRVGAPVFVSEAVLDEAGTVVAETQPGPDIDAEVEAFRSMLDDLDPSDFGDGGPSDN